MVRLVPNLLVDYQRTVINATGVVSKLDLVAKGTEEPMITMHSFPKKYNIPNGIYFVKMRNLKELRKRKPLAQVLTDERLFFNRPPWKLVYFCSEVLFIFNLLLLFLPTVSV